MRMNWGRIFLVAGACLLVCLFTLQIFAQSAQIIEVRRNIPLADADPIYRDYYIDVGSESLRPNQVVTIVRKINIKDATGSQSFGELTVPVGQMKIIFIQNRLAVGREYRLLERETLPMLEQIGILVGDQLDLKGSFIDNKRSSAKTEPKKETAIEAPEAVATVVTVESPAPVERVAETKE